MRFTSTVLALLPFLFSLGRTVSAIPQDLTDQLAAANAAQWPVNGQQGCPLEPPRTSTIPTLPDLAALALALSWVFLQLVRSRLLMRASRSLDPRLPRPLLRLELFLSGRSADGRPGDLAIRSKSRVHIQ
ncbi:hypothetical protein I317_04544 [Kwoniella heveanensis CBS 569]|nr:hypothetical protein I317_04544 [Kwoniella heveanensis CBS 569]